MRSSESSFHDLQTRRGRIDFLGLPVDRLNFDETVALIEEVIQKDGSHRIVMLNAGKVIKARKDPSLLNLISSADIISPDGMWIVLASRFLGVPLPGRVNGTDLMEELLNRAHQKAYRIFFLGARQEVVEKVVKVTAERFPGAHVAGYRNGYFDPSQEAGVVAQIRESEADILFVALPSPQKEYFVFRNLGDLNVGICHGVGGSFDVLAGLVRRAPEWMQRTGCEFLYRWWQEPRKMSRRNLVENPQFLYLVLKQWFRRSRVVEGHGTQE